MAKKKAKKKVAKNPSGLAIVRNGEVFTLSWKRGSSYTSQQLQYRLGDGAWTSLAIGAATTAKNITVRRAAFYPNNSTLLPFISFRVRGVYGTRSAWVSKTYILALPNRPFVEAEHDSNLSNVCRFKWNFDVADNDALWFTNVEWQSILIEECDESDGSKLDWDESTVGWRRGTSSLNENSEEITEDTSQIAGKSFTRWFRIRSRGPAGDSTWNYSKRVYASPFQARITEADAESEIASMTVRVSWEAQSTVAHPIESTTVQYAIAEPAAGMRAPNGASWTDADVSADTSGTDSAVFDVQGSLEDDQCLFVKVDTNWDQNTTYGVGTLALAGYLADPSNVTVTTNPSNHRATITATNESQVSDSFLAVNYRTDTEDFIVGVIPHGQDSITVQCPDWGTSQVSLGVYAVVGSYTRVQRADGVTAYNIVERMRSKNTTWQGGSVPVAPEGVTLSMTANAGTIRVAWDWSWEDATDAVLAWSDHDDAWESTAEPSEYTVSNLHASQWNISGLETGKRWYVRVKLITEEIEGPWSEMVSIDLSSAPTIPSLSLSKGVVTSDEPITAFWSFVSTDGTGQAYAELCEATIAGGTITYGNIFAHSETAQQVTFLPSDVGWNAGETHSICLRVTSASGKRADKWSDPVTVIIAPRMDAEITDTSLEVLPVIVDEDTRNVLSLTELPLEITVSGAGAGGSTSITVERAVDYHVARPDESEFDGFAGEAVAIKQFSGEGTAIINRSDLIGNLDDGAIYKIIATVKDSYGQTATDEVTFEVHWEHQAVIPMGIVEVDETALIAKITPVAVSGIVATDSCDIYRLSADNPELVVKGAEFGTMYVDPYPAIGGGYRFVCVTANGDYITTDNVPAWVDVDSDWEYDKSIIDFDGEQVLLYYNLDLSNSWEKDFQATKYLGGAVKGDWNAGVVRTATLSTIAFTEYDGAVINGLRLLAEYAGICHIRTLDGSSFSADLQIAEDRDHDDYGAKASFSITGTRVDPEGLDGLTYAEWSEGR